MFKEIEPRVRFLISNFEGDLQLAARRRETCMIKLSTETLVGQTSCPNLELFRRGKTRDVYRAGKGMLLIVATDRISAFDVVLDTLIPKKGEVLTALSRFWFQKLRRFSQNHMIATDLDDMPDIVRQYRTQLEGRCMLVVETEVFPVECVVRGYVVGSGWKDYQRTGEICGIPLPKGLVEADKLTEPIFTPATKAPQGQHDENISYDHMASLVGGKAVADYLRYTSLRLYSEAAQFAWERGIIIADTKFEFGYESDGTMLLVDEALTPDSSRFWPADLYQPGRSQPSFDKQFVRDSLDAAGWDKKPPAPSLPPDVVQATTSRYLEAHRRLTGREL